MTLPIPVHLSYYNFMNNNFDNSNGNQLNNTNKLMAKRYFYSDIIPLHSKYSKDNIMQETIKAIPEIQTEDIHGKLCF